MNRFLLLVSLFMAVSITLCLGQSDPYLGRATSFSVLAGTQVNASGPETTGIDGNLGISPGQTIVGENYLLVSGKKHKGTELAAEAQLNAKSAYTTLSSLPVTGTLGSSLGNGLTVTPGVYRIDSDATLNGIMVLDGQGDINSTFVFIIKGNFTTFAPTAQNPTPSMISQQGAEAKNVYWVVEDEVNMGSSTSFVGNIIANNDITLASAARIQGRAISLNKAVNFHFNTVFLPIVVYSNLTVEKTAEGGDFSVGAEVTYTIKATNRGPGAAIGVEVKEKVPAGLEYIRSEAGKGTYDPETNIWTIGDMSNGQQITLTIVFKVLVPGVLRNQVDIIGDNPDPDENDNTDEVPIITICPELNPELSGSAIVCANSKEVLFTATPIIGAKYEFALPEGWTKVDQIGNVIRVNVGTASGKVQVTVTDQCGKVATAELNVEVTGAPAVATIEGGGSSLCFNTEGVSYTATGVSGEVTYEWLVTEELEIVSGQGSATVVVKPKAGAVGGTLTVKVTNSCSFESVSSKIITVTPAPVAPAAIAGSTTLCVGAEATYTATVVPGATYTWSVPEGWAILSEDKTTNQIKVRAGTTAGTIQVIANNTCSSSEAATLAVGVMAIPAAPTAISGATTPCAGTEQVYTITPIDGATSYTWTVPTGWSVIGSHTSNTIKITVGSTEGTLKVAAVNTCGTSDQASLTITPTVIPARPGAITGPAVVCATLIGNEYSIAAVPGATTYTWTVPTGWEITSGQGTTNITVSAGAAGGTVKVVAANVCGTSPERAYTITINTVPATPVSITGNSSVCAGVTATYAVTAVTGVSYTWTVPATGGWEIVEGQGTAQVKVKVGTTSGNVEVSAANDCGASSKATKAITVSDIPVAPTAISGETTPCAGTEHTYSIDPVDGATSYEWVIPSGWAVIGSRTSNTIKITVGSTEGSLKVAAVNTCGKSAQASLTITPNTIPVMPGAITSPGIVCSVSQGNVYSIAAVPGATTYNWTVPAGWEITSGQGTTSITVSATATGGTMKVTAANACGTSPERTLTINVSTIPQVPVAITGKNDLCAGVVETYAVTAVAGVSYTWTVPATGGWEIVEGQGTAQVKVKIGTTSGNVEVSAVNDCGASSKASRAVAVTNVMEAPAAIRGTTTACIGTELTYSIDAVTGATGYTWSVPATWTIVGSANSTTLTVKVGTAPGNIKVAVTNRCGAGAEASLAVTPTLAPEAPGAITNTSDVCISSVGNVFSVAAVPGATSYTWTVPQSWTITGGQGTNSITVTASTTGGAVSVTATNDCGTSPASTRNVDITLPPAAVGRITDNSNVCEGLVFTADAVEGATSYTWSVSPGFTIVSGQGTATVSVKADSPKAIGQVTVVSNNGGCASSVEASAPIDASLADGELSLPKAFSPNGDGKNDTWLIANLLKFPDNEVVIFNRWGSEVYKQRGYKNDWMGKGLEQGTYFYKVRVKLCDGVYKEFTGYVAIFR